MKKPAFNPREKENLLKYFINAPAMEDLKEGDVCKIHKTKLVKMEVPISYGLPSFEEAWLVAVELFPNSFKKIIGGCVVDYDFSEFSEAMVCNDCRQAKDKWRKEQILNFNNGFSTKNFNMLGLRS